MLSTPKLFNESKVLISTKKWGDEKPSSESSWQILISKFLENFSNIDELVVYFDKYLINLSKKTLNSYLKSVSKL